MNKVNSGIIAIFLAIAGCADNSVPKSDDILAALNRGDFAEAEIGVRKALKADPANRQLIFLNGRVALEAGNVELAKAEFKKVLDDPALGASLAAQARELLAKAYLMSDDGKRALETLGSAAPTTALAWAVKVGAHSLIGDGAQATAALAQGLAAFPNSADLLMLDGERAMANGDLARAQALAARAIKQEPRNVPALLFAARSAMAARNFDEAVRQFDTVLALRPKHQTALLGKATIALDRGDRKAAEALLDQAAQQLGGSSMAINYLKAQMTFDAGKVEDANKMLQAMGDVSRFPPAVMLTGLIAAARGQHEQAIEALRGFMDAGGEDGRVRLALASSYRAVGRRDEAWKVLQPLADAANAAPQTLAMAAALTGELKLPQAAAYAARQAAAAKGDPLGKELASADAAIRAGDWRKADGIYAVVLRAQPGTANVVLLNNAANARLELGDKAGAQALARRALAAAPNDPIVLDTLAWSIFQASGTTPEAVGLMRRAANAMPGNPEIRRHALAIGNAMQAAK
jgi:Flp pilus assembly protein TadD